MPQVSRCGDSRWITSVAEGLRRILAAAGGAARTAGSTKSKVYGAVQDLAVLREPVSGLVFDILFKVAAVQVEGVQPVAFGLRHVGVAAGASADGSRWLGPDQTTNHGGQRLIVEIYRDDQGLRQAAWPAAVRQPGDDVAATDFPR
jgi:hypothetical protein